MIVSVNLARASANLAEQQVIVKKGEAVVNLGLLFDSEDVSISPLFVFISILCRFHGCTLHG